MGTASGPQPKDRLRVAQSSGDPAVVAFAGELDMHTTLVAAQAVTVALARVPRPEVIVIDLSRLLFLAAAGVRTLHAAVDHAFGQGTSVRFVVEAHGLVARALTVTGMAAVLDLYPDLALALNVGGRIDFLRLADELWNP